MVSGRLRIWRGGVGGLCKRILELLFDNIGLFDQVCDGVASCWRRLGLRRSLGLYTALAVALDLDWALLCGLALASLRAPYPSRIS